MFAWIPSRSLRRRLRFVRQMAFAALLPVAYIFDTFCVISDNFPGANLSTFQIRLLACAGTLCSFHMFWNCLSMVFENTFPFPGTNSTSARAGSAASASGPSGSGASSIVWQQHLVLEPSIGSAFKVLLASCAGQILSIIVLFQQCSVVLLAWPQTICAIVLWLSMSEMISSY
jgi:hypothetical protein